MHQQLQQQQHPMQHFQPDRSSALQMQYARMMGETTTNVGLAGNSAGGSSSMQMTTTSLTSTSQQQQQQQQAKATTTSNVDQRDGGGGNGGDGDTDDRQLLLNNVEQNIVNLERNIIGQGKWTVDSIGAAGWAGVTEMSAAMRAGVR